MGSGKSSVGRLAAEALGRPFIDVDERIVEMTGRSIEDLFAALGEEGFRRFESGALAQALAEEGAVIATGGGAPLRDDNWLLIRDGNVVIHLTASPEVLLDRIGEGKGRPLAADPAHLADLMRLREARYAEAGHTVDTTDLSERAAAEEVVRIAEAAA